jgi:peptide/nickel transport system substrate-binding protein
VYVKNPDYYDAPKPYFDRIVAPIITNSNVSLTAFTAQKIYSGISMNATQAQTLKAQIPELQWAQEGTAQQSITFNVTRAPWNNVKVRQAISMALDRQGFINTALLGFGRLEATSRVWFSDAAPSDDDLRAANNGNVTAARELLAAAGYPNGFDGGQLLVAPGTGGDEQPAWIADQLKRNLNIALVLDHPEYAIGYDRFRRATSASRMAYTPAAIPIPTTICTPATAPARRATTATVATPSSIRCSIGSARWWTRPSAMR